MSGKKGRSGRRSTRVDGVRRDAPPLYLRLAQDERRAVERAARAAGLSPTDWGRRALARAITRETRGKP